MKLKIAFVLFEDYHQRKNIGSSRIRGHWVIENLKGAERFKQGGKYDVIVFQKTYWKEMARNFKGVKILDICDPDWLDGLEIANFCKDMDAVVVPTEAMAKIMRQVAECPVKIIPDRVKFEGLPKPKKHKGRAKSCVWFGYFHNTEVLENTLFKIKKNNLLLRIISNGVFNTSICSMKNIKWESPEQTNEELLKADFAILPRYLKGRDIYKSDNKVVQCWALGLPVATNPLDMDRFMEEKEREVEGEKVLTEARKNFNVKTSAKEYQELIESIIRSK